MENCPSRVNVDRYVYRVDSDVSTSSSISPTERTPQPQPPPSRRDNDEEGDWDDVSESVVEFF